MYERSLGFGKQINLSPNIKHMKTSVVKNIVLSLVISAITAVIPASVSAQSTAVQASENLTEVSYLGNSTEFFKFEVNLKQPANQRLILRIMDEHNNELYREAVTTKEFTKLVKIARTDYARLHFYRYRKWKQLFKNVHDHFRSF
jgi:hypothetical protein